jgi:N-acetylglutamate synthase-like GNAT family acetyltransferase
LKAFRLTERLQGVLSLAESELQNSKLDVLYPIHIFMAALKENTGVLAEFRLNYNTDINALMIRAEQIKYEGKENIHPIFNCKVSDEVLEVIKQAEKLMNRYGQIYLNEGHMIKGILTTSNKVSEIINKEEREKILNITASCRDLVVCLRNYKLPELNNTSFVVTRAKETDRDKLYNFIKTEFNEGWAKNVNEGLVGDKPPVFIAFADKEIIGFGAYDVVRKRKGLFGPMGVKKDKRVNRVGYSILHKCLNDMNEIGYEYAIISEAGPIEFYEKSCGL